MATYHAIAAISEAIKALLERAAPRPEFDGAIFSLYQSKDFQNPMDEGVSLYLFRVATSSRRNLPARLGPNGEKYRPPLPLDLYYLLTAWGRTPERQQLLLGWSVRELGDHPILPASLLNDFIRDAETFRSVEVFRPEEAVELVFEPLSLQDSANLWEPLKPNLQASATYVARMVALESSVELPADRLVETRQFNLAKAGD